MRGGFFRSALWGVDWARLFVGWLVGLRYILHSGYEHNGSFALTVVI